MTKRIYQSTFAVVFITLLLCVVLISGSLYGQFEERMYQMLEQSSVYMEQAIENEGIEYLESLAGGGNRVTLIQADGKVIYDNYVDAVAMDNHSDREEFIAALATGEGRSTRHSFTLGKETLYYAIQLENGMVLRLSTIQRNVGFWVLDMVKLIAGIALVVLSLAAFFSAKLCAKRMPSEKARKAIATAAGASAATSAQFSAKTTTSGMPEGTLPTRAIP